MAVGVSDTDSGMSGGCKISDVISNGCSSNTIAPFYAIVHVYVEDRYTSQFTTLVYVHVCT